MCRMFSRAARSFAIPAFISLSRPQGALDYGSKYNAAHWLVTNLGEQDVTEGKVAFAPYLLLSQA